jgi:hypothetical protein
VLCRLHQSHLWIGGIRSIDACRPATGAGVGQQNPDSRRNAPADNPGRPADDASIDTREDIMKNIAIATGLAAACLPSPSWAAGLRPDGGKICEEHYSTRPATAAWRNAK